MTYTNDLVEVKIQRQVLWIGSEAIPLRNVTATWRTAIEPDRGGAVKSFLKSLLGLFIFMVIAGFVGESISDTLGALTPLLVMAGLVALVVVLVKRVCAPRLHRLIIEMASSAQAAVESSDPVKIETLEKQITEAINNPQAEFHLQIENAHIGDKITQNGNHNVGKQVK